MAYTGTVHLDPSGQAISTTLARGATKLLIQQFFTALDDLLGTHDALDTDFAAVVERYDLYSTTGTVGTEKQKWDNFAEGYIKPSAAISPQSPSGTTSSEQRGVLYTLVHLLGLGQGEPEQEQIWTRRLRGASTIVGLLFLVWLGTRLPRPRAKPECPPLTIDN